MSAPGKIVFIVLDSIGIGEAPDAAAYGDAGANTLGNTAKAVGGLYLPNLQKLGLGNIGPDSGRLTGDKARGLLRKNAGSLTGKRQHDRTLGNCRDYHQARFSVLSEGVSCRCDRKIHLGDENARRSGKQARLRNTNYRRAWR